jgi:hypothetical protein
MFLCFSCAFLLKPGDAVEESAGMVFAPFLLHIYYSFENY